MSSATVLRATDLAHQDASDDLEALLRALAGTESGTDNGVARSSSAVTHSDRPALADVVSIDEARARLRGSGAENQARSLAQSMARHPAGTQIRSGSDLASFSANPAVRVVLWAVAVTVAFALALTIGLMLRPAPYSGQTWAHSVTAGESIWGLAQTIGSSRPLEDLVTDIIELNGLQGATIHPGQEILLPIK